MLSSKSAAYPSDHPIKDIACKPLAYVFAEMGLLPLRAGDRPGAVMAASVMPGQRPALDRLGGLTAVLRYGEWAGADLAQRRAAAEQMGQRQGMRIECSCAGPRGQSRSRNVTVTQIKL